jgi:hypothetical protein
MIAPMITRTTSQASPPNDHTAPDFLANAKDHAVQALTAPVDWMVPTASATLFVLGVVTLPLAGLGAVPLAAGAMMAPAEMAFNVLVKLPTTPLRAAAHGAMALYDLARYAAAK